MPKRVPKKLASKAPSSSVADMLIAASFVGSEAVVNAFISVKGVNVNGVDKFGVTALHAASEGGHVRIVDQLLRKGAKVDFPSTTGKTALTFAVMGKSLPVVKRLVEAGCDVNAGGAAVPPLAAAALAADESIMQFLIDHGASTGPYGEDKATLLHMASHGKNTEAIKFLLRRGQDVNAANAKGATALSVAAFRGHYEGVVALLDAGADMNSASDGDFSPLHAAMMVGQTRCALLLVQRGASLHATDESGRTPLEFASYMSNKEVVDAIRAKLSA
jgi:ankyrin